MTDPQYAAIAAELAPCPFCGEHLKHVESWARSFKPARLYHEYHHPTNDCLLRNQRWNFSDEIQERKEWMDAWNTRSPDPASHKAGAEAMREKAADMCDRRTTTFTSSSRDESLRCAALIRALALPTGEQW